MAIKKCSGSYTGGGVAMLECSNKNANQHVFKQPEGKNCLADGCKTRHAISGHSLHCHLPLVPSLVTTTCSVLFLKCPSEFVVFHSVACFGG